MRKLTNVNLGETNFVRATVKRCGLCESSNRVLGSRVGSRVGTWCVSGDGPLQGHFKAKPRQHKVKSPPVIDDSTTLRGLCLK